MRLKLKEDPDEWRKAALFGALGLTVLSSVLHWRHVLPVNVWVTVMVALACFALGAWLRPRWFRGYYRFSSRLGFRISQFISHTLLTILFFLVLTPMGLALRLFGKDLLHLKRSERTTTYWRPAKGCGPLDRLF